MPQHNTHDSSSFTILVLPGDGIGPEVCTPAASILGQVAAHFNISLQFKQGLIGGAAIEATGNPLPAATLTLAAEADAILLGAVGGPQWDRRPPAERPETALLQLRRQFNFFANLRPIVLQSSLAATSAIKENIIAGTDILLVRELVGGLYFGEPRGRKILANGVEEAWNTLRYDSQQIEQVVHRACVCASTRRGLLCLVDKANVLETSQLWREVSEQVVLRYNKDHAKKKVRLSAMYVDNAAMQLIANPKQFDVIVTENMFGDILADLGAQLVGSLGMLPSASQGQGPKGLYEPVHGSAPDLAGQDVANPCAAILCGAMMLRYSLGCPQAAAAVEQAVVAALDAGLRTVDLGGQGKQASGCTAAGRQIEAHLRTILSSSLR